MDTPTSRWLVELRQKLAAELRHHTRIEPNTRPWELPVAAALSTGLPLLAGAALGRLDFGLVGSLGGLVFLYLPETPLHHRMVTIMACAFAFVASYALGLLSSFAPPLQVPALTFIAILSTMLCRFYAVKPPGSLFFIMVAAIGLYTPTNAQDLPHKIGLLALGTLGATVIAFFYSLRVLRRRPAKPVAPLPEPTFDYLVFDSVVIGLFVGLSLVLAKLFALDKAYWVTVGCIAVLQGTTLRAVWNRQLQRVVGTAAGMLLSWALLSLPLTPWSVCALVMTLSFVIELIVVRHYALAALFITPLTILLAESPHLNSVEPELVNALIRARFLDTALGCAVGFIGGVCLHHPRFRDALGRPVRRWFV